MSNDFTKKDETQAEEYYDNDFWQKNNSASIDDVFKDLE